MEYAILILYAALMRRFQGLSAEEMPIKRQLRMLGWIPLAAAFWQLGGWEWWALAAGAIPGLWSWMPGRFNTFAVWRLFDKQVHTAYTEMIQGAAGAALAAAVILAVQQL